MQSNNNFPYSFYSEYLETINSIKFTHREIDIMTCILHMRGTSKISSLLLITSRTVETHIANIMRKIDCHSREGIIDFVEKSEKSFFIRKHYQNLLIQSEFKKRLKEISNLIRSKGFVCNIFYTHGEEDKRVLISTIEKDLTSSGIKALLNSKNSESFFDSLMNEVGKNKEHSLYVLSRELIDIFQTDKVKQNTVISQLLQKILQNPSFFTFIWTDQNTSGTPQEFTKSNFIDFREQENYYLSFFETLKRFVSDIDLSKIISEFKIHAELIQNSFEKKSFLLESTSKELREKGNRVTSILESILKNRKKMVAMGSILSVSIFCFGFFIFKESQIGNVNQKTGKHATYPFRSNFFIPPESILLNRSGLIMKIQENLKGSEPILTLALVGVGGSGKTTLARQYACQQNTNIVWHINAETQETLMVSFETLADRLCQTEEEKKIFKELQEIKNIPEKKEKIILWIREKLQLLSNWFLIFDNVEKFTDIQDYFPTEPLIWGRGKVIVVTRDNNIKNNRYIMRTLQIEELNEKEKLELFDKIMSDGKTHSLTVDQKEEARKFLKEIPSFPLDVSLATYYLKSTHVSYAQYLEHLKKYSSDFNSIQQNILKEVSDYVKTRYSIVTLSLQQIIEIHKDFKDLLILINLLDYHNIPRFLLDTYSSSIVIDNFIYHLKKYCFITHEFSLSSILTFSMHSSTQEISLNYLIKTLPLEKSSSRLESIVNTIDHYTTDVVEQEDFLKMKLLINHCEKLLTHGRLLSNITIASIQGTLGCMYYYLSDYSKSKKFLEDSLSIFNKYNSENHGKKGHFLIYLGNVYRKLGNYEKARILLEQSLLVYQKHSIYSSGAARSLGYLGIVYRNLGDFKQATHLMEQSFNFYKKNTENKVGYAWISAHLGNTYMILGQYEKAKTLLEQSLIIYKKQSKEYVGVGWVLGYLGNVYRKLGHYEKARVLLEQSLMIHRKHFSKNHVYIAASLAYLGNVYKDLKNPKKAKNLLEESLRVYQKTYGEDHIETARVLNNLGQVYLLEDHLEASERLMKKALKIFQHKKYPEGYKPLESLADFYLKKSMQEMTRQSEDFKQQAIDSLKKALEILKVYFPNNSDHIIRIQLKLKDLDVSISTYPLEAE